MLHNPSTLYSAGDVKFDSTPYLRIAMAERQRRDAREDALNQYYQKLPDTVNDKGTRDQEIPVINQMKNEMQEYGVKNRAALLNPKLDGGAAQLGMQQRFRNISGVVRESQGAGMVDHQLGQMYFNPNNQGLLNSDEFLSAHEKHTLPVTDPNFKKLDIAGVMANRPFDEQNYVKDIKGSFKFGEGVPTVTPHPTDKNLEVVTTTPVLDDNTKQGIYATATYKLHNDKPFEKFIAKNFSTPEKIAPLNEISIKTFGHPIKEPEDIAAAYTVSVLPNAATKQALRPNLEVANQRKMDAATLAYQRSLNKQRIGINAKRENLDRLLNDNTVGYVLDDVANNLSTPHEIKDADGKTISVQNRVYKNSVPKADMDVYNPSTSSSSRVKGFKDLKTGEEYYLPTKDLNGHYQLVGDGGIVGSEASRRNYINKQIPANKEKRALLNGSQAQPSKAKGKFDNL